MKYVQRILDTILKIRNLCRSRQRNFASSVDCLSTDTISTEVFIDGGQPVKYCCPWDRD